VTKRAVAASAGVPPSVDHSVGVVDRTQIAGARAVRGRDAVAREEPLEIQLDGASLAVVMRTPGNDEELALGLLSAERVIASRDDVSSIRHATTAPSPDAADNILQIRLRNGLEIDWQRLRRNLYASASCGICGKATIEATLATSPPLDDPTRFAASFFRDLPVRLRAVQPAFDETGGLHAAGLFAPSGELLAVREDVGRHNAVDKVVGWALGERRLPLAGHVLLVSGRVSYEIAEKALAARIPVVAAVSAPSSLAVALAEDARMAIVGFLRGETMNVYGERSRVAP
jgi:FdhD protein